MLERRRIRRILSALSRSENNCMSHGELLTKTQLDLKDLDEFTNVLINEQVIEEHGDKLCINKERYQAIYLSEISVLKEVLEAISDIRNRINGISLINPLGENAFDLSQGSIVLLTDRDNQRLIQERLRSVKLDHYSVKIMMLSQLLELYQLNKRDFIGDGVLEIID